MLKVSDIRELIRLLDETSLHEVVIETGDLKLALRKAAASTIHTPAPETPARSAPEPAAAPRRADAHPAEAAAAPEEGTAVIASPMVGTFYRAPSPTSSHYVEIGSRVTEKTVVCIVEAMKLLNEIEADMRGEIVEILAENGQLVEYGQPLFRVRLT